MKLPEIKDDGGKAADAEVPLASENPTGEIKPAAQVATGLSLAGGAPSLALRGGWDFPVLRGLFAVGGFVVRTGVAAGRAVVRGGIGIIRVGGRWAANRRSRARSSMVRRQPVRNAFRIANGGPLGWRFGANGRIRRNIRNNGGWFRGGAIRTWRDSRARRGRPQIFRRRR